MPVQSRHFNAVDESLRLGRPHLDAGNQKVSVDNHAADDVAAVQAGHGEVDGQKRVVRRKQVVVELRRIFKIFDDQKSGAA